MQSTKLRAAVATVAGEIALLSTHAAASIPPTSVPELQASWARLEALLALGPEPEVRARPMCSRTIMRAATRCGHCWTKLRPPAANGGR